MAEVEAKMASEDANVIDDETKQKIEKEETKQEVEKEDTKQEMEKEDTKQEMVKEDTKQEMVKEETTPEVEKGDTKQEIKTTDVTPDPNLEKKIREQMEYYFGNHNLMRDKFLKEKIKGDDGWVSIETMLNFNRLKKMSEDHSVIANALKNSDLIEVNEAMDKVRRSVANPLPEDNKEYKDERNRRTVYAKGFPQNSKLDDLMTFFKTYGGIENVFMRRDFYRNVFKGSVFTTFNTIEDAQKFVDESDTKFNDESLEVKLFKEDYFKKKTEERKKKPTKEKVENNKNSISETKNTEENKESDEERAKRQMTQNAILHFKGINPETSVGEMKDFFKEFGDVGYVDYEKGQTEGYLRMKEPNSAAPTLEKLKERTDGKIMINDSELEMRTVEGDEELQYWTRMMKDVYSKYQRNKRQQFDRRGGRGGGFKRGGGRGGRGRGGGHRGGKRRNRDGPGGDAPPKMAKTE